VLARTVPIGVAGVVFLSGAFCGVLRRQLVAELGAGGLSDSDVARYLHAINELKNTAGPTVALARLPTLTFSFGRGLQGDAMTKWAAGDETGAKEAFARRAKVCFDAARGELKT
jgi:fructose-bisphosphate aldolase class I